MMGRAGFWFLVLGVGSFILPKIGLQFRLMNLFGENQNIVAIILVVVGILLTIISRIQGNKSEQNQAQ